MSKSNSSIVSKASGSVGSFGQGGEQAAVRFFGGDGGGGRYPKGHFAALIALGVLVADFSKDEIHLGDLHFQDGQKMIFVRCDYAYDLHLCDPEIAPGAAAEYLMSIPVEQGMDPLDQIKQMANTIWGSHGSSVRIEYRFPDLYATKINPGDLDHSRFDGKFVTFAENTGMVVAVDGDGGLARAQLYAFRNHRKLWVAEVVEEGGVFSTEFFEVEVLKSVRDAVVAERRALRK